MDTRAALGFEEYVRARQASLLRSARRLTPNPADAQDLLQTALARTYPAWDGISDKRHADAYVRRVLLNTRTSWWRSRRFDEYATDQLPESPVDDGAEQRADRAMLLTAMDLLTRQQRAVVALRYYEGMSTAETARTLGISAGTVKSTLHRALHRLRVELERQRAEDADTEKSTPAQGDTTVALPESPRGSRNAAPGRRAAAAENRTAA